MVHKLCSPLFRGLSAIWRALRAVFSYGKRNKRVPFAHHKTAAANLDNHTDKGNESGLEGTGKSFFRALSIEKLVGSRFEQMESKIQGRQISSGNRVYHLHKSVPL